MIKVSDNLRHLADLTNSRGHKLYIVGGYVRNMLLGLSSDDIDIAGSMLVDDMKSLCKQNGFDVKIMNERLGTIAITIDTERYEYTSFRQEVYDESGKHQPDNVKFVTDPKIDAIRRDFTVNAIYYDIVTNQVYNYFDSMKDLDKRIIRTVQDPKVVFSDDGLRILRMVRFACELGFKPEKQTYRVAKEYAFNVKDISKERILRELQITVNGGLKYHLKNETHSNAIKYYNDLNIWQYIFGPTFKNFKVKTYGKMYNAYVHSDGSYRYLSFICLVLSNFLKVRQNDANLGFAINLMLGNTGLRDSNKSIKDIYDAYHFAQKMIFDSPSKFLTTENCLIYENLSFEIMNYLSLINPKYIALLREMTLKLKRDEIPFRELDLKIDSNDLIVKAKVNPKFISKIRSALFEMCVKRVIVNEKDVLIKEAISLNERLAKTFGMKLNNIEDDVVIVEENKDKKKN